MAIDGVSQSLYVQPASLTQAVQSPQSSNTSDSDGDGSVQRSHGHGHRHGAGQMQGALMQALQSLGLEPAPSAAAASAASGTTASAQNSTTSTDSDSSTDGSTSGVSSVKQDMRQFMNALFQAVKGEGSKSASGTASTSTDPKANFASGLSALISQVSNGSAPADLQAAFSKLSTDLQQMGTSTGTGATAATTGSTSSSATLQSLLTQMQQNLGYGATSSAAAIGNLVSTQV